MVQVLASFLFSYYFVNIAGFPNAIKKGFGLKPFQRLKPFDCVTCLSVWMAVVLYFINIEISIFLAIIFGAGFIGYKIK